MYLLDTMKMFVMTNLIRLVNHLHLTEHGHLKETNKVSKDINLSQLHASSLSMSNR